MKKFLIATFLAAFALACMVGFAACTEDPDGPDTPHEHAFGAWETVTAATCTEAGEEERVCTECGAKETRAVAALGHRFEVRVISAATCTEAGEEERTCTECGAKETAAVAPLGHDVAEGICALCGATFEATDADCFSFRELEDGSYAISDVAPGASLPADVVIPWEYNGKPVTAIDDMVGYEDASARTLLIPAGIVSVGDAVFAMCKDLESVTLGRDVAEFGKSAFRGSPALASLAVAQSNPVFHGAGNCVIETQGKVLRVGCKESVIPADGSVTQIAEYAFYFATGLQHIEFPQGLTSIGDSAFNQCRGLTELVIPESVTQIGIAAFCYCSGLESVSLPAGLSAIGWTAFYGCTSLKEIALPAGLETVEAGLFAFCSALERVSLPESITSIGWGAFYGCTALREIELPANLAQIEQQAFQGCSSLGSIVIPEGVTQIGERAFQDCASLESVVIPDRMTRIEALTFFRCSSLKRVFIGKNITEIVFTAFSECELTELTVAEENTVYHSMNNCIIETQSKTLCLGCNTSVIPDDGSVTQIGDGAFSYCSSLTEVVIPDCVTAIGDGAFSYCSSLTDVIIPDGVTRIGNGMFRSCTSLQHIVIPDSVTQIGYGAFEGCQSLQSAVFESPNGWSCIGIWPPIAAEDLSDPAKAAQCLTDEYVWYDWVRE